jgi:hypothetical protein
MLKHSFILAQAAEARNQVRFDPENASHVRSALTYFNAMSPNRNKWIDEVTGTQYAFIDELEYPSLPDMVREKLMYAQIRKITGMEEIQDTYQILSRMNHADLMKPVKSGIPVIVDASVEA